jgi:hypothetical protein
MSPLVREQYLVLLVPIMAENLPALVDWKMRLDL